MMALLIWQVASVGMNARGEAVGLILQQVLFTGHNKAAIYSANNVCVIQIYCAFVRRDNVHILQPWTGIYIYIEYVAFQHLSAHCLGSFNVSF